MDYKTVLTFNRDITTYYESISKVNALKKYLAGHGIECPAKYAETFDSICIYLSLHGVTYFKPHVRYYALNEKVIVVFKPGLAIDDVYNFIHWIFPKDSLEIRWAETPDKPTYVKGKATKYWTLNLLKSLAECGVITTWEILEK